MQVLSPDVAPIREALAGLASRLTRDVLLEGDEGYAAACVVWNAMIVRRPVGIVRCRKVEDVVAAVRLASGFDLPISIRGGGHNVAGHALGDGAVALDLSEMRAIRVDPEARRAEVEGGATWADVDAATQAHGLATPGGLISETGVGGLTLSGGIGWLRCRHGLSIDNLLAADVVLADGSFVRASADENPESVLGAPGRRWQLRRRRAVHVCAAFDRAEGHVLGADLSAVGRGRSDPLLA